jgi:hypothetical protein
VIGLLLTRALHTSEFGGFILRLVPDPVWSSIHRLLGLEGAETTGDAEIVFWLSVCLLIAAALVLVLTAWCRRWFARR